jgi:hypothetical protein
MVKMYTAIAGIEFEVEEVEVELQITIDVGDMV